MLQPQQVKPFILHPDALVSNAALRYFAESYIFDHDLMPLFLERLKSAGKNEKIYLHHAHRFPQTNETVTDILALLGSPDLDFNAKFHLKQMLVNGDNVLLRSRLKEIMDASFPLEQQVTTKLDIAALSDDELWETFEDFFMGCRGKYFNEINAFLGDTLIHELARRRTIGADIIMNTLKTHDPDDFEGYETVFITQLAGVMRIESAIPVLCDFLSTEDEVLQEKATKALIRIGTAEVVRELSRRYPHGEEGLFQLYASDVFGKIKLPESEDALLRLLPLKQDLTYATKLADGLCELCSVKGIPVVRERIQAGYDAGYLDLRESLYVNCIMNDIPLPEAEEWKADFDQRYQQQDTPASKFTNLLGSNTPYVSPVKVGRNDPCPCGSGKKYKKCCG